MPVPFQGIFARCPSLPAVAPVAPTVPHPCRRYRATSPVNPQAPSGQPHHSRRALPLPPAACQTTNNHSMGRPRHQDFGGQIMRHGQTAKTSSFGTTKTYQDLGRRIKAWTAKTWAPWAATCRAWCRAQDRPPRHRGLNHPRQRRLGRPRHGARLGGQKEFGVADRQHGRVDTGRYSGVQFMPPYTDPTPRFFIMTRIA